MKKLYYFLFSILLFPFSQVKAEINNNITKTKSGNIIPSKDYYQKEDLLEFNYITPTVKIETGGWGLWQEDKVEKSTTKITLDIKYNGNVIRLATYNEARRGTGHDVDLPAISGTYSSNTSIEKLLGTNNDTFPKQFYFTIYLTYHVHAEFNKGSTQEINFQEKKDINVYTCNAGALSTDESILPNISPSNASPIYGLYNSDNNMQYPIISTQNPSVYGLNTHEWISWNITDGSKQITKKESTCSPNMSDYDQYLKYADFLDSENHLLNGSLRYIYRTYVNKDFSCHSNTLKIEVIDTLSLDGFEEDELTQFICPPIGDDEDDLSCNSNNAFSIKGKAINWSNVSYPKSIYGAYYGWEYKTSSNMGWQTITDNLNTDSLTPDLCLSKKFLNLGKTYYFRQFVLVKNFGNRKIYANGEHNYVTVQHYHPITKNNFLLDSLSEICEGTLLKDTLLIFFIPENGRKYKNAYENPLHDDNYNLKYTISSEFEAFNAETYGDRLSIPFILQGKSNVIATVKIEDGCANSVSFPINLNVSNQPQLLKTYVDVDGGYANYTESGNRNLSILVPEERNITIRINDTDPEKSSCRYFISYRTNQKNEDGEYLWNERSVINTIFGHTISHTIKREEWYNAECNYIKIEKERMTTGCVSEPLYLCINYIGSIIGNNIEFKSSSNSTIEYTCKNSKNPLILGGNVSGGYGDDTYSYVWQYSNDSISWTNMLDSEGKVISSSHLLENSWNKVIDKKYYFRRMATSIGENASESSAIKSFSNVVIIAPYTAPKLQLAVNQNKEDFFACYDSKLLLTQTYLNPSVLNEEGYGLKKFYGYEDKQGIIRPYTDHRNSIVVTTDTVLYAATEFCGDTIFSEQGIKISVGEDLTIQEEDIIVGPCLIRGDSIELSIDTKPGYTYGFIFNHDTIYNANTKAQLPLMGNLNYIAFKTKKECIKFTSLVFNQSQTKEPIEPTQLQATSSGGVMRENEHLACYGNVVNIFVPNEKTSDDIVYEWKVNNSLVNTAYTSNMLSSSAFDLPDKEYLVTRTSHLMSGNISCQHVTDTIRVHTYPIISNLLLENSKDSICYGEDVSITLDKSSIKGGSGNYLFLWNEIRKDTVLSGEAGLSTNYHANGLKETTAYSVTVSDAYCTNEIYQQTSPSALVFVEKDLSFDLSAAPSTINAQSLQEGNSIATLITSNEIGASDKISCWLNGREYKHNESYLTGINYSLKADDFADNIASFTIERYGSNLKGCKQLKQIDILLNEGFDGTPVILSSQSLTSTSTVCGGDSLQLSIDTLQLPKYDNKVIEPSKVSYQWYKRNGESWSTCGSDAQINVIAIHDATQEYRCKLSYTPAGGTRQSVFSNTHSVVGIGSIKVNNIFFIDGESLSNTYYVCKGEIGLVSLTADASLRASHFQWYQKEGDGEWKKVPSDRGTTGSDAPLCTIDLSNYTKNTSFKLVCTNECGTTSESSNQIQLLFNVGATLSTDDIILTSNNIYDENNLFSVSLCVPRDYRSTYFWSCDPSFSPTSWKSGNPITLDNNGKGFTSGDNAVYVYMVSKGMGNCLSDTIAYHFNVFEKIKSSAIGCSVKEDTLCPNNGMMTLSVNEIKGGDGNYQIDWMYKSKGMTSFSVIKENANLPFEYLGTIEGSNALGAYSFLNIGNLSENCEFYALISCVGDYPGRTHSTDSYTKGVYQPLRAGTIDNHTLLMCYNNSLALIEGTDALGGNHQYEYQWLKSTDKQNWEPINEQTESSYVGQALQEMYKLKQTTYFCRVTTDGCGNKDTSLIKTVQVKNEVLTTKDDILYTPLIARGDKAKMWGINNNYDYVWLNRNLQVLDTTSVQEVLATDNIDETSRTYYAKTLYDGCLSSNYDTIHISTYDIDGGHLSFDESPASDKKYWIYSGANAGRISADGGGNLTYRWFYLINGTENSRAYALYSASNTAEPVTTSSVLLDTCNLKSVFTHTTGTQLEKKVSFYRVSYFTIDNMEQTENSDTISLYIVPTLSLASTLLLDGSETLAGTLSAEKEIYCNGETGSLINGTVDQASPLYEIWSNGTFGPYLYNPEYEEFSTWFEYGNNNTWTKSDIHHGIGDYAQFFNLDVIDTSYTVRRAFNDGCSTVYSNSIKQNLSDKAPNPSKVIIKATTPEGKVITEGIEMGDALSINYTELGYECYWFADEDCTDTLCANNQLLTFNQITEKTPTVVYLKRKDNTENGCFSSALAIPLTFYTKSTGGHIYKDQFACRNEQFSAITSGRLAEGFSYAPTSGAPREFHYQWQVCLSSNLDVWTNITDAIQPDSLSANIIMNLTSPNISTYYIRRQASTIDNRVVYSDTIQLTFYNELQAGVISLENEEKNSFCHSDSLPFVLSSSPTGGYYDYVGFDGYSYGWEISINNHEYVPVTPLNRTTGRRLDLDYCIRFEDKLGIDFSQDNHIQIRALYADVCDTQYSEPLSFTLWAMTHQPSIYQEKDSCESDAVTIKAYDTQNYTYTWVVLDDEKQVTWSYTQDSLKLQRVSEIKVTEYGVSGTHKESGCKSDFTYFNIDSLPRLHQDPLEAPVSSLCYNSTITIKGGKVSGGNSSKEFLWEYSYDGISYNSLETSEDLLLKDLKQSLFVRRIVHDLCSSDTSNTIFISVREKIEPSITDISYPKQVCKGQYYTLKLNPLKIDSLKHLNEQWKVKECLWTLQHTESDQLVSDTLSFRAITSSEITYQGFDDPYQTFTIQLCTIDSTDAKCSSEAIHFLINSTPSLDSSLNRITCSNLHPCNGEIIEIEGTVAYVPSSESDTFTYAWFQSDNQKEWAKIPQQKNQNLYISIQDSIYIKREVSNQCYSNYSNIIALKGKPGETFDYVTALGLTITTYVQEERDSVELIIRDQSINTNYILQGDSLLPDKQYGVTTLPYTADEYTNKALYLQNTTGCYNGYRITPIRGGRIFSEGNIVVCKEAPVPTLRVTECEGGSGDYKYQWQYKNGYVREYVNIPSATNIDYTPDPVTTQTWFRRMTTSGEYISYSNEVALLIADQPSLSPLLPIIDSASFANKNLTHTDGVVELTKSMSIQLACSVSHAQDIHWEYSDDNETWHELHSETGSEEDVSLTITGEQPSRYYRLRAESECGTTYSNKVLVTTSDIPEIIEEEIVISGLVCQGDTLKLGCFYLDEDGKLISGDYYYQYESNAGIQMYTAGLNGPCTDIYYPNTPVNGYIYCPNVQAPFEMTITRVSKQTGATYSTTIPISVTMLHADFEYIINNKTHTLQEDQVNIEQGELVEFRNLTEGEIVNTYWELIEPMNTPANVSPYGLFSFLENPYCYFYNGGRYNVTLHVTDVNGCQSSVSTDAITIPSSAVRNTAFKNAIFVENRKENNPINNQLMVYPIHFHESIHILWGNNSFSYQLYDELGIVRISGSANEEVILHTEQLTPGVYILRINDQLIKLLK